MRTGGVEQARMSRRKKSPKPKPKKKQQGQQSVPNQGSTTDISSPSTGSQGKQELSKQDGQQGENEIEQALKDEVEHFGEHDKGVRDVLMLFICSMVVIQLCW